MVRLRIRGKEVLVELTVALNPGTQYTLCIDDRPRYRLSAAPK